MSLNSAKTEQNEQFVTPTPFLASNMVILMLHSV